MDLTLRQLHYFVAVADERSYTRAARRLFVSQSALSAQILRLEHACGATLVDRSGRSIDLTEAGRSLYADARRILADVEGARTRVRSIADATATPVRLVHTMSVAFEALPEIIDEFEHADHGLRITVKQMWSDPALDAVAAGEADIALVREFQGRDGLHAELVRREPLVVALSDEHALSGRDRLTVDDFRGRRVAAIPETISRGVHSLVGRLCDRRGFQPDFVDLPGPENRETVLAHLARNADRLFVGPASMATISWPGVGYRALLDADAVMSLSMVWAGDAPDARTGHLAAAIRRVTHRNGWLGPADPPPDRPDQSARVATTS